MLHKRQLYVAFVRQAAAEHSHQARLTSDELARVVCTRTEQRGYDGRFYFPGQEKADCPAYTTAAVYDESLLATLTAMRRPYEHGYRRNRGYS